MRAGAQGGFTGAHRGMMSIMPAKDGCVETEVGLHHLSSYSGCLGFSEVLVGVGDCRACLSQGPSQAPMPLVLYFPSPCHVPGRHQAPKDSLEIDFIAPYCREGN